MQITLDFPDPPVGVELVYRTLVSTRGQLMLTEAARLAELSPRAFSRRFKKYTGKSFRRARLDIRLRVGAALLQQTTLGISDIAHQLGYSDRYKFERSFKRHVARTPAEYRRLAAGASRDSAERKPLEGMRRGVSGY